MTKDQLKKLEADLWTAADNLRANSDLKSSEYSIPVLGIIFLRFADNNYRRHEAAIHAEFAKLKGTRREKPISEIAIEKCGFYLPDHARYDHLLNLPEAKDIAKALKEAEEKKVKLAAKSLLARLTAAQPKVLVQEWFKDTTSKKRVAKVVEDVLDEHLPQDGYDRVLFKAKCDAVFDLVLDLASHGLKWAA